MTDWNRLKTEYVTSQISYKALAEKHGVSYKTLYQHARIDHWADARRMHTRKTVSKSLDKIGDQQAEDLVKVDQMADQLLEKLETAIEQLDLVVIHHRQTGENQEGKWERKYDETAPGGAVDRKGLRQLASCLKDLKQIKAIQTELDKLEQEARIERLKKDPGQDGEILVTLEDRLKDFSQ